MSQMASSASARAVVDTAISKKCRNCSTIIVHLQHGGFAAHAAGGIPLAAGVLYPFLGLLLSPVVAAAGDGATSVSAIGNVPRLPTVMAGP